MAVIAKPDLTTGSIFKSILKLSLPIVAGCMLESTLSLVDMLFVGKLGSDAVAAVGMSGVVFFLMFSIFFGLSISTTAMVARAVGEKDHHKSAHVAGQALYLALIASTILGVIGFFISKNVLSLLGAEGSVLIMGTKYLKILFLGNIIIFTLFIGNAAFRGVGDVISPLIVGSIATASNIILDPLLIYGMYGFPKMGVTGSAVASIIAEILALAMVIIILLRKRTHVRIKLSGIIPDFGVIWNLVKIGIPGSVQMLLRSMTGTVIMSIVSNFGTQVVAAYAVGRRLEFVFILPILGLGVAATTLVGQNLGASLPHRASKCALLCMLYGCIIMAISGCLVYVFSHNIIGFFNSEPEVISAGVTYLRINVLAFVFIGMGIVLGRALNGAGETLIPMLITLVCLWGLQIPAAIYLVKFDFLKETGVWWAMVSSNVVHALLIVAWFMRGSWKKKRI